MHNYDILLGQDIIGKANVEREGLYYHFRCRCRLPSASIHYVILQSGSKEFNLGVCIPDGDVYRAHKRIAMKQFDNEEFKFHLIPKQENTKIVVAVDPQKPFDYLQDLENSQLDTSNGSPQISLNESKCLIPGQQDNDQSQESQSQ